MKRTPLARKSRLRHRSRSPSKAWGYVADREWQVRVTQGQMCAVCRKQKATAGHHLIPRRYRKTRWLLENGLPVCHNCHSWINNRGWEYVVFMKQNHAELWAWAEWMQREMDAEGHRA